MNHPHIGSHHSIRDDAHLWHFQRTMPRGSPPFAKPRHRSILIVCAAIVTGLLAGLLAGLAAHWFL
jgi:hypothetical protein